jgi:hypothetical protein
MLLPSMFFGVGLGKGYSVRREFVEMWGLEEEILCLGIREMACAGPDVGDAQVIC